ncbi:MAG: hypothetical protein ABI847_09640, partial [Anaerolineales bacterium]
MPFSLETITYADWPNCYRLSDGRVEVIATADVGPRLIRFGFVGGPNEFVELAGDLGQVGGQAFRLYGGHRFWHAPEHPVRSYLADNAPVAVEPLADGLRLTAPVEAATQLQKELVVELPARSGRVRVTHRLHNRGLWPVRLAPWALSAMAPGGTAIVPLPPRGTHTSNLLPVSSLVMWAYTDLADPRWTWGRRHVLLRSQPGAATPQKVGASVPEGWLAYARAGHLFVKRFSPAPGLDYPDQGSQVEIFTDNRFLELETLGPLADLT